MPQFNYKTGEIIAKIVYYGPSFGGKTTSLQWLHTKFNPLNPGQLFSLETKGDRTLFFDMLPVNIGRIDWMTLRVKVYTVPGEVRYNATRRMLLTGVDAIVFVADSEISRYHDNLESLHDLTSNLHEKGLSIRTIPLVFQYNKRDLPRILPLKTIDQKLNFRQTASFGSIAIDPHHPGVLESFIAVLISMIKTFNTKYRSGKPISVQRMITALENNIRKRAADTV